MAASEIKPAFVVYSSAGPFDILPPSAEFIIGQYAEDGWNHGKRVYKRIPTRAQKFLPEVKLFFWDESDGKDLGGWWFGDEVGSGQVWSRNLSKTPLPPMKGWQCPADGPVQEHVNCVAPLRPPKPVFRVKIEEPAEPGQAQPPHLKRRWGNGAPSGAPPAKRPETTSQPAEALRLVSSLGKDAPWGTQHLLGEYVPLGLNHGRKAFCRRPDPRAPEEGSIWLYYWDARDGRDYSGWWLGRRIGGRERYGRAEQHEASPPLKGWRVPPDGTERQDLAFVPQGKPEEVAMTEDGRLAAATATVEAAEAAAYGALEASLSALGSGTNADQAGIHGAMDRLKESAVEVEQALASLSRHDRAARTEPGGVRQELGPLCERLQVLLESVQQELSRASWHLERPPVASASAVTVASSMVKKEPAG
mmetsp:Transcript_15152/g.48444  ORF Transcript_15152/g.48444 Transcript_15152/m.48444 type:complete len:419 (+) Transcript_15152:122-1378(+)